MTNLRLLRIQREKTFQVRLAQLERLDPEAYEQASIEKVQSEAGKIIAEALKSQLVSEAEEEADIWEIVGRLIDDDKITVAPGKKQVIWKNVSLFRRTTDDQLVLIRQGEMGTSRPVAYLGRDWGYRNGDYKAIWKKTSEAWENYNLWATEGQKEQDFPTVSPGDGGLGDNAFKGDLPKETRRWIEQGLKAMGVVG